MLILREGDRRVVKMIKKNTVHPGKEYRFSLWVFPLVSDQAVVLRSSLSRQVIVLSKEEWSAVCRTDLSSSAVVELIKLRFLVERDFDDLGQYQMILSTLRIMEKRELGVESYTILPTTACNARCVYCYQQGIPVSSMSPETVARTVDFILATKRADKIRLHWFGGEPLCASGVISEICRILQEKGVDYWSEMTTNGSLFTPEMIREAVGLWNLETVQVSMDGEREDYETRKQYLRPDLYTYDLVMANIRQLVDAGVRVVVRCNCDLENMDRAYAFLDDCAARFGDSGKVLVSVAGLNHALQDRENSFAFFAGLQALREYTKKLGLAGKREEKPERLTTHQCMADSCGRNIVIDPEGNLYVCDDKVGREPIGNIFDSELPPWPTSPLEPAEECKICCFLPDCTPFRRSGCPICPEECRLMSENAAKRALRILLKKGADQDSGSDTGIGDLCR